MSPLTLTGRGDWSSSEEESSEEESLEEESSEEESLEEESSESWASEASVDSAWFRSPSPSLNSVENRLQKMHVNEDSPLSYVHIQTI